MDNGVRISELNAITQIEDNDILAGVETSDRETKKVEMQTLKSYINLDNGSKLNIELNPNNYQLTISLLNYEDSILSSSVVDLPIESLVKDVRYDQATKEIVFVLESGKEVKVNISDLVSGLVSETQMQEYVTTKINEIKGNVDETVKDLRDEFLTDQARQDEELKALLEGLPQKTVTGTDSLYYEDGQKASVREFTAKGNVEQDTTTGANLILPPVLGGASYENGVITTNANTNSTYGSLIHATNNDSTLVIEKDKIYYLSFDLKLESGTCEKINSFSLMNGLRESISSIIYFINNPIPNNNYQRYKVELKGSADVGNICKVIYVQSYNTNNAVCKLKNFMISEKNIDYEPFTNGTPAPNPEYPMEVKTLKGWNLCSEFELGNIDVSTGNNISSNNIIRNKDFINVKPNSQYTISVPVLLTDNVAARGYDKNGVYVKNLGAILPSNREYSTFNIPNDIEKIKLVIFNNSDVNTKIQIVKGTEQKPYLPYGAIGIRRYNDNQERIDYIDLQGNELLSTDELELRNGHIWLKKNMPYKVFDGSENWILQSINSYGIANFLCKWVSNYPHNEEMINNQISSHFTKQNTTISQTTNMGFLPTYDTNISQLGAYFRISSTIADTVEKFKIWLSQNKPIVYYQLAEPIEIDLGEVDIKSLKGVNNVTVEAELPATYMEETYINDINKELEQIKNALLSTGANV